jgi:transposase
MNETVRNDIVRRFYAGQSRRQIARDLHLGRVTVARVLAGVAAQRAAGNVPAPLQPAPRRARLLDAYEEVLQDLLRRYPQLSARRLWEELRAQGFAGSYGRVWERVRQLRPRPAAQPVVRFETGPGCQAQMDYSVYDIDFSVEGRRRIHLFSYVLGYSRRAYLRFVQAEDFETTVREHVRAFSHLGGVAACCLYDNMKVVVLRWQDDEPLYNPRFLAFATHYGFKPQACRPRRPQTKGKIERHFDYVENNLLAGRTFQTLDHLNEVTLWWLAQVADVRRHSETNQTPLERHAAEVAHLLPLPAQPYNVDAVVYRTVTAEGFIAWRGNHYSVPWRHIGQLLPVRLGENELLVYSATLEEIARHPLLPRHVSGQQCTLAVHHPQAEGRLEQAQLLERFAALGPVAATFFHGLVQSQRYGRHQAHRVLALLGSYARKDVLAALERAVHYGAFAAATVERILAVQARPRTVLDQLAEQERDHLETLLRGPQVAARPITDYRAFFVEEVSHGPDTAPASDTPTPGPAATAPGRPASPEDQPGGPDAGRGTGPG